MQGKLELTAKTFFGLEQVLAEELEGIGAGDIQIRNRAVTFTGTKETMYKANYHLRTAISILKPVCTYNAQNEDELYKYAQLVNWDMFLKKGFTFAVESTVHSKLFKHSQYAALKIKDAIVDQLFKKYGSRPDVDTENPNVLINLHIANDLVMLSLNSSGEPLYKRGYRVAADLAPLNESLAAGLVLLSGWNKRSPLIDPMCGSGTIAIEAALIAHNIPPGIYRQSFGFEKWFDFDQELFENVTSEESDEEERKIAILASDMSPRATSIAIKNIQSASLGRFIRCTTVPFEDMENRFPMGGTIIINPPYGERMRPDTLKSIYSKIGSTLKHNFPGFTAWVISSNQDALRNIGLQYRDKFKLFNGTLECFFQKYEMFSGPRKVLSQSNEVKN